MSIPNLFNDIIQKHLNIFSAWLPITNNFALGDYGIIADGVFEKIGNIKADYGIDFTTGTGPATSIDFTSANTTVINFNAGVQVDVIPEGAVDAKVTFKFQDEKSFLVKSPQINLQNILNVQMVGKAITQVKDWEARWKVVYETYEAQDAIILSTIAAGTDITFTGEVSALQSLKLGNVGIGFSSTKELGLKIQGKAGVIGLGLFRVKTGFLGDGGVVIQTRGAAEEAEADIELIDPANAVNDL